MLEYLNWMTLLSNTSNNELYCALALSKDWFDILLALTNFCNKIEKWMIKKLLFAMLAILRGFKDVALRTNAYFNDNFSRSCNSYAARKFPTSFLKAGSLRLFGLRLDSSSLMLEGKQISILAAGVLMFLSDGSIWTSCYKLVALRKTSLRIILSKKSRTFPPRTPAKKVNIGLSAWKHCRKVFNLWSHNLSFGEVSGSWIIFYKTTKLFFLLSGWWFFLRI